MKANGCGTHLVLKIDDIEGALSKEQIAQLDELCAYVRLCRSERGKDPNPEYLVCNRDEPYAQAVENAINNGENLKRNGNTRISYLYRDASNYKVHNEAVVSGHLSPGEIEEIVSCLEGRGCFIPSQVGLPEERFSELTGDDTPYFELDSYGFKPTRERPTVDLTAAELLENFRKAKGNWTSELFYGLEREE